MRTRFLLSFVAFAAPTSLPSMADADAEAVVRVKTDSVAWCEVAFTIEEELKARPQVADVVRASMPPSPILWVVRTDPQRLAAYGLTYKDVDTAITIMLSEAPAMRVIRQRGRIEIEPPICHDPGYDLSAALIHDLMVTTRDGVMIPVGALAELSIEENRRYQTLARSSKDGLMVEALVVGAPAVTESELEDLVAAYLESRTGAPPGMFYRIIGN